jgi:hypothetical protein
MYPRSEILFPHSCIKGLRNLLDGEWSSLVDRVLRLDESCDESLAFSLMMIKLCGCLNCDMGSYKASLGCDVCSQRAVMGVKGNSAVMLKRYEKALEEVRQYLAGGHVDVTPEPSTLPDSDEETLVA